MASDALARVRVQLVDAPDVQLEEILALQRANLRRNCTSLAEGFVTAEYDLAFMRALHEVHPSVIAVDQGTGRVCGYVIAAASALAESHALLGDMIRQVRSRALPRPQQRLPSCIAAAGAQFVLSGQLCVAAGYRGLGFAARMYAALRESVHSHAYSGCLTDIPRDNPRSLQAHRKAGFEAVDEIEFANVVFDVVWWEWGAQ